MALCYNNGMLSRPVWLTCSGRRQRLLSSSVCECCSRGGLPGLAGAGSKGPGAAPAQAGTRDVLLPQAVLPGPSCPAGGWDTCHQTTIIALDMAPRVPGKEDKILSTLGCVLLRNAKPEAKVFLDKPNGACFWALSLVTGAPSPERKDLMRGLQNLIRKAALSDPGKRGLFRSHEVCEGPRGGAGDMA